MTDRTTAATTKPTVITSEMLDSMANIDKSVGVTEHKNAKYDLGNLMVYVADDYDFSKLDNDTLDELARVNTQHLIARIFNLETKVSEDGRHAILPEPTTRLPRMRPIPEPKPMTTWEKFAARKGIKKKKKALMVVDEQTGEYRRRFGYKKANNIEDQWAIEHKEGQDDSVDPWTAERIKKKARVEKNQRQQRRNMLRAQQANPRNLPGTIDLASAVGKKRLKRNAIKAGKTAEQKSHLEIALATAQRSTASMGKFDQLRKGEPLLKAPKAPRRDAELQNPDVERKQHQSILKKVLGRAKEKDSFVVERAMASIGAGHIRHKELDTARAAQKIGRKVARELKEATGGKKSGSKGKSGKKGKKGKK